MVTALIWSPEQTFFWLWKEQQLSNLCDLHSKLDSFQTSECLTTAAAVTTAPACSTRIAPAAAATTAPAWATRSSTGRTTTTRRPTPAPTAASQTTTTRPQGRARGRAPSTDTSLTCRMKWPRAAAVLQTEGTCIKIQNYRIFFEIYLFMPVGLSTSKWIL